MVGPIPATLLAQHQPRVLAHKLNPARTPTRLHYFSSPGDNSSPPRLPPTDPKDDWQSVVGGVLAIVGVIAFFASPLGGVAFTIFNSLLLLSILAPLFAFVGFQLWMSSNTIEGSCPQCGAAVRVVKNQGTSESTPNICLNCGTIVQASWDNQRIEMVTLEQSIDESSESSIWGENVWNMIGIRNPASVSRENDTLSTQLPRRGMTIIDVEVQDNQKDEKN